MADGRTKQRGIVPMQTSVNKQWQMPDRAFTYHQLREGSTGLAGILLSSCLGFLRLWDDDTLRVQPERLPGILKEIVVMECKPIPENRPICLGMYVCM
jgi:hypothetical protein